MALSHTLLVIRVKVFGCKKAVITLLIRCARASSDELTGWISKHGQVIKADNVGEGLEVCC